MANGWRRAFCTSIPKEDTHSSNTSSTHHHNRTPRLFGPKFSFFSSSSSNSHSSVTSNPSTPPPPRPPLSDSNTPTLRCRTNPSSSTPSSPRSPSTSTFSLLHLKNSLRLSKATPVCCAICLQNVKAGQGTAIFTAECSHSFHVLCITTKTLSCPLCVQPPLLLAKPPISSKHLIRLYDDDEPLMSPVSGIRFNPIPESDEEETHPDLVEFPGFFSDPVSPRSQFMELNISSEAAVVAVGRSYETYAVLLKLRAPTTSPAAQQGRSRRTSVDLVLVVDVGAGQITKLESVKRAMRALISSLSSNDRLSIVAFSSTSKRLLHLRRMTPSGRRSARRIVETLQGQGSSSCVNDALRKAAKVIQDRKERNHFATIILLKQEEEDDDDDHHHQISHSQFELVSSTRFSHLEIPVHTYRIGRELLEYLDAFVRSVSALLSVVVLDLRIQLSLASGSAAGEIAAVYSCTGRPGLMSAGLSKLGDLCTDEETQILIELKVPVPADAIRSRHLLSVRSSHKDPSTKQVIYGRDQSVIVPRPHSIRSSDPAIQRLRSLFVMTRAVAESRRLTADFAGAERLLASARAVLSQPSLLKSPAINEFRRRVEAELAEVRWRRQAEPEDKRTRRTEKLGGGGCCVVDEPLTPTSAWKAAERLAKVAIMRKSMNRVSDLHGFEDARF